jgi:DNA-binding response OmpR family regulator
VSANRASARRSRPTDHSRNATVIVADARASVGAEVVEQLRADGYCAALARTAEHARALSRGGDLRAIVLGQLDAPEDSLDLLCEIRRGELSCGPGATDRDMVGDFGGSRHWDRQIPAIVLSAGGGQLELLRAFEMGADDFVGHARDGQVGLYYFELRARLRAVLRRAEASPRETLLRIGSLEIDTEARLAVVDGVPVALCRLEFELLVHLSRNPRWVCSKQELLRAIWKQSRASAARTVDSHASRLRRKLASAGAPGLVVNVRGVGYRLL